VSWPRELELGSWWQQRQEVGGAIPNWWWPKLGEERLEWELGAVMEAWAQQILERWYEAVGNAQQSCASTMFLPCARRKKEAPEESSQARPPTLTTHLRS
jgi:hypothetical protein